MLTHAQRGWAAKATALLVFLEYLSGPLQFSSALRRIPRAIKTG